MYYHDDLYLLTEVEWDWATDEWPSEPQAPPMPSREPAVLDLSMLALFTLSRKKANE